MSQEKNDIPTPVKLASEAVGKLMLASDESCLLGAGILISENHFLVCAHVVGGEKPTNLLVEFNLDNFRHVFFVKDWIEVTHINKENKETLKRINFLAGSKSDFMVLILGEDIYDECSSSNIIRNVPLESFDLNNSKSIHSVLFYVTFDNSLKSIDIIKDILSVNNDHVIINHTNYNSKNLCEGVYLTNTGLLFALHHAFIIGTDHHVAFYPWIINHRWNGQKLKIKNGPTHWLCEK